MDFFNNPSYANAGALDSILNGSIPIGTQNGVSETGQNKDSIIKIETVAQYPWKNEVVSYTLWWSTDNISSKVNSFVSQLFADTYMSLVEWNPRTGLVEGTIFFTYGVPKKNENDMHAFKLVNKEGAASNNLSDQLMMVSAQQKNGNVIVTKEFQEAFAGYMYLDAKVNKNDPDWLSKIEWNKYISIVVDDPQNNVCLIKLDHVNVSKIINTIIREDVSKSIDANGATQEVVRPLDIRITPGTIEKTTGRRVFEINIFDVERTREVADRISGTSTRVGTHNFIGYR